MAESVTPQAARQAVQVWKRLRGSIAAGDALAVLVPQLLDQLAALSKRKEEWRGTAHKQDDRIDALESEKAQLLDQLANYRRATDAVFDAERDALVECANQRDALGERCHQLETALREIEIRAKDQLRSPSGVPFSALAGIHNAARAALGDTPPRASCNLCGSFKHTPEYHSVGPPPPDPPPHAVEPPQPSPTNETCHHGRPFDLCAICSARIPYERPPQPETPEGSRVEPGRWYKHRFVPKMIGDKALAVCAACGSYDYSDVHGEPSETEGT